MSLPGYVERFAIRMCFSNDGRFVWLTKLVGGKCGKPLFENISYPVMSLLTKFVLSLQKIGFASATENKLSLHSACAIFAQNKLWPVRVDGRSE